MPFLLPAEGGDVAPSSPSLHLLKDRGLSSEGFFFPSWANKVENEFL